MVLSNSTILSIHAADTISERMPKKKGGKESIKAISSKPRILKREDIPNM